MRSPLRHYLQLIIEPFLTGIRANERKTWPFSLQTKARVAKTQGSLVKTLDRAMDARTTLGLEYLGLDKTRPKLRQAYSQRPANSIKGAQRDAAQPHNPVGASASRQSRRTFAPSAKHRDIRSSRSILSHKAFDIPPLGSPSHSPDGPRVEGPMRLQNDQKDRSGSLNSLSTQRQHMKALKYQPGHDLMPKQNGAATCEMVCGISAQPTQHITSSNDKTPIPGATKSTTAQCNAQNLVQYIQPTLASNCTLWLSQVRPGTRMGPKAITSVIAVTSLPSRRAHKLQTLTNTPFRNFISRSRRKLCQTPTKASFLGLSTHPYRRTFTYSILHSPSPD